MPAPLSLHGRPVPSVFHLLGHKENDITASIGWALAHSQTFRDGVLRRALGPGTFEDAEVRMQEYVRASGITDIELKGKGFHVVVEAKRGWQAPSERQLRLYLPRFAKDVRTAFVTMSECEQDVVAHHLPPEVEGHRVVHMAWHEVQAIAKGRASALAERRLLADLVIYLERVVKMQDKESNWVMTVAINNAKPKGYGLTFKEVVTIKNMYFHTVGGQYSREPVNYVGFRWDGHLQEIRHVESWRIFHDVHEHIPELNPGRWPEPHYLYTLGPAIVPPRPVPLGKIYAPGPVHAMLDLLLTSATVAEARAKSKERMKAG